MNGIRVIFEIANGIVVSFPSFQSIKRTSVQNLRDFKISQISHLNHPICVLNNWIIMVVVACNCQMHHNTCLCI